MSENNSLDNKLAELTDTLLSGEQVEELADPELNELMSVVQRFHQLVDPATPPDAAFQDRLSQRLKREWNSVYQRPTPGWRNWRVTQLAALAAGVAAVALVFVVVLDQNNSDSGGMQGTALGSTTTWAVIVIAAVAAILLLIWLKSRKL